MQDPDGKQRQKSFETKKRADDHRKRKEQELDAWTYLDDRLGKQPLTAVREQWTNQKEAGEQHQEAVPLDAEHDH
ncbi:hypothetical protein SALBM135S_02649 [Streptomyces alboniger]